MILLITWTSRKQLRVYVLEIFFVSIVDISLVKSLIPEFNLDQFVQLADSDCTANRSLSSLAIKCHALCICIIDHCYGNYVIKHIVYIAGLSLWIVILVLLIAIAVYYAASNGILPLELNSILKWQALPPKSIIIGATVSETFLKAVSGTVGLDSSLS